MASRRHCTCIGIAATHPHTTHRPDAKTRAERTQKLTAIGRLDGRIGVGDMVFLSIDIGGAKISVSAIFIQQAVANLTAL